MGVIFLVGVKNRGKVVLSEEKIGGGRLLVNFMVLYKINDNLRVVVLGLGVLQIDLVRVCEYLLVGCTDGRDDNGDWMNIIINKMDSECQNQYFEKDNFFQYQSDQYIAPNRFSPQHQLFQDIYSHFEEEGSNINSPSHQNKFRTEITKANTKPIQNQPKSTLQNSTAVIPAIMFQTEKFEKYKLIYKGSKDDTVELNINFKTVLCTFFRQMMQAKELNQYQIQKVNSFNQRVPSFHSLQELFKFEPENLELRQFCQRFFESSEFISRVLSSKCKMKTKIQMIKYIQKLRMNINSEGKIVKWKESTRDYLQ